MNIDIAQVRKDLCIALGVRDLSNVSRVTLTIDCQTIPTVTVERSLINADGLQTAVEMLNLVPVAAPTVVNNHITVGAGVTRAQIADAARCASERIAHRP